MMGQNEIPKRVVNNMSRIEEELKIQAPMGGLCTEAHLKAWIENW